MIVLLRLIQIIIRQIFIKVGYFYLFSGVALTKLKKFDKAITMFDCALKINPYNFNANMHKGRIIDLF